jgi:putative hydrolase of the HAD superfamily
MLPKGILFDLDDTIIAFDAVANPTWQRLCETYARKATCCDPAHLFNAIQEARTWYWSDPMRHQRGRLNLEQTRREIVRLAFATLGMDNRTLAHEMADTYSVEREALIHLFPRVAETLQFLIDHQVSLALITNGAAQKQRQKVERFGLKRFFKTILIEGELGYGKPEEAVYLHALDDLGLTPDAVWSVGDNLAWDVAAPQQLGIWGIWHDVRAQGLPLPSPVIPDKIITSIAELMTCTPRSVR